jgi:DtxR family transcriptional regulator, Mn-dependent transcriptional regulator
MSKKCDLNGYNSLQSVDLLADNSVMLEDKDRIQDTALLVDASSPASSFQHPAPNIQPMASLTVENYVKTIYLLAQEAGGGAVATGQIAAALDVLPGTVTSMLKTLDESNLATYTPYEGVRLTSSGRALALRVLRRHRLIEQFLAQTLNLTWDEVHHEAENMEHAVSDSLIDRIDDYLGHPATDPHGDPIPKADGTMALAADRPLSECAVGDRFRIARVIDQSSDFLRYLSKLGLSIGAPASLVANDQARESLTIRLASGEKTIARELAAKLMVR